jgi:hypothetical protein
MNQYLVVQVLQQQVAVVQVILVGLHMAVVVARLKLVCHWPQQDKTVALKYGLEGHNNEHNTNKSIHNQWCCQH